MTAKPKTVPELRFTGFEGAWKETSLSEAISSIDAGVGVNSEDIPVNGDELGILKTSCVTKGFFDSSENKRVLDPAEISRLKEPVSKDSIIISRMNTPALVGLSGLVPQAEKRLFLPDRLWAAKVSPRHSTSWIAQLLASEKVRGQLSDRASGTSGSMKNITKGDVLSLPVTIPTLPEQRKIADFLTAVDGRLAQLNQKKALLEAYKKGVMQQVFTQALRFQDDHGNDFPDWEEKTLGAIASFSKGCGISKAEVHEDGALPCIRYGELYTHYAELNRNVKSRTNVPKKDLVLSQRNDVIIPASGETHIDIAIASFMRDGGRRGIGRRPQYHPHKAERGVSGLLPEQRVQTRNCTNGARKLGHPFVS